MTSEHVPQIPSRQSESNAIGSSPRAIKPSLTTSSISRNDMSGLTFVRLVSRRTAPADRRVLLPPNFEREIHVLVAPLRAHVDFLVDERLLVQHGRLARRPGIPRRRHTRNSHRRASLRRPAFEIPSGNGRRRIRGASSASRHSNSPNSRKSATRPACFQILVQVLARRRSL